MTAPADRVLYGEPRADGTTPFWRMPTLWAAAAGIAPTSMALGTLSVLDEVVWFGGPNNVTPTVRRIAEHARDIFAADMSFPIIMTRSGDVLDGAHRVAKAYLAGHSTIEAVVLDDWPSPDGIMTAGSQA